MSTKKSIMAMIFQNYLVDNAKCPKQPILLSSIEIDVILFKKLIFLNFIEKFKVKKES